MPAPSDGQRERWTERRHPATAGSTTSQRRRSALRRAPACRSAGGAGPDGPPSSEATAPATVAPAGTRPARLTIAPSSSRTHACATRAARSAAPSRAAPTRSRPARRRARRPRPSRTSFMRSRVALDDELRVRGHRQARRPAVRRAEADLDGLRAPRAGERDAGDDRHPDEDAGRREAPHPPPRPPMRVVAETGGRYGVLATISRCGDFRGMRGRAGNHPRGWSTRPQRLDWTGIRPTTTRGAPLGAPRTAWCAAGPRGPWSPPAAAAVRWSTCSRTPPRHRRRDPAPCCADPR